MASTAGYSGTPLPKKLGITPDSRVLLDRAPAGFALSDLPAGCVLHRRASDDDYDVIVSFCLDLAALTERWAPMHGRTTTPGALWIAWPKRASGLQTDLDENVAREYGLAHGRVDVKVCAIDQTWSGLKFVVRLTDRPGSSQ